MNQKIILLFLIFFLVTSFSWLAYTEKKQQTIVDQWFLYFTSPQNNTLDFTIENYTNETAFTWQLLSNQQIVKTEKIEILKGAKKTVTIEEKLNNSTTIQVLHNEESKVIYK